MYPWIHGKKQQFCLSNDAEYTGVTGQHKRKHCVLRLWRKVSVVKGLNAPLASAAPLQKGGARSLRPERPPYPRWQRGLFRPKAQAAPLKNPIWQRGLNSSSPILDCWGLRLRPPPFCVKYGGRPKPWAVEACHTDAQIPTPADSLLVAPCCSLTLTHPKLFHPKCFSTSKTFFLTFTFYAFLHLSCHP